MIDREKIIIMGARQNNLKGFDLEIPRNKLVVITGLSGSGKSSLAFDTIYADGQRRYLETLSSYARQFIRQLERPEVDRVEGLSPTISIEQRIQGKGARSTVGTASGIYDYLRLLYARAAELFCPYCGLSVSNPELNGVINNIVDEYYGEIVFVLAPIVRMRKGEHKKELEQFLKRGFLECRIDGHFSYIEKAPFIDKNRLHNIDIVIDKIKVSKGAENRLRRAIELAKEYSDRLFTIHFPDSKIDKLYAEYGICRRCGRNLPEVEPKLFSFNSVIGACAKCKGLGKLIGEDEGYINGEDIEDSDTCPECFGRRLKKEASIAKINGLTIMDLCSMEVGDAYKFIKEIIFKDAKKTIADALIKEVESKLEFIRNVGLAYLTLDRALYTLSIGEMQRIRLASQIGSDMRGILYILDEPTIGLHPSDNEMLLKMMKILKERGNSIIIVEHDEATIRAADYIIDLGPGAGADGGYVVNIGALNEFMKKDSLTAKYLNGAKKIPIPMKRRRWKDTIQIVGASEHNLKNINVKLPLGVINVVTGVSGSGKSTLVIDVIYKYLHSKIYKSKIKVGKVKKISGWEKLKRVVLVDQSPIGKTPRSTPATYISVWTLIREFFSKLPDSRKLGYDASRFSYNVSSGMCPLCKGLGVRRISMSFLPDSFVTCEECHGLRYNKETLKVEYEGKNIAQVLNLTVQEAYEIFSFHPEIKMKLQFLIDTALGYIRLGQPSPSLSGGEAQRLKLAKELWRRDREKTLYILDEPTTGLHFEDVYYLIQVLQKLVDNSNTILIIEHNMEVVKSADYIIDLGPGAGEKGGDIVNNGTPEQLAEAGRGLTSKFIKRSLNKGLR